MNMTSKAFTGTRKHSAFSTYHKVKGKGFSRFVNMYLDHENGGEFPESIPGYRILHSFKERILSILPFPDGLLVHAGSSLYRLIKGERSNDCALSKITDIPSEPCIMLTRSELIYLIFRSYILLIDSSGEAKRVDLPDYISGISDAILSSGRLILSEDGLTDHRIYFADFDDNGSPIFSQSACVRLDSRVCRMLSFAEKTYLFTYGGILRAFPDDKGYRTECIAEGITAQGAVCFMECIYFISGARLYSFKEGEGLSEINISLGLSGISNPKLISWRGYLAICGEGEILLLDPRNRYKERGCFDLYPLKGIGTWRGHRRVFRYSGMSDEGLVIHKNTDEIAEGEVMSFKNSEGKMIYYTEINNRRYSVYPTEEFIGGDFYPSKLFCNRGELLYFTTDCNDLCLFNNDLRGVAPDFLRNSEDFDPAEYGAVFGGRIHPYFYSFASHSAEYLLETDDDDIDMPYVKKSTVRNSLILKVRTVSPTSITVRVFCDGRPAAESRVRIGGIMFNSIDFSALDTCTDRLTSVTIPEAAYGWKCKKISVYSKEFCSPIEVTELSYQYRAQRSSHTQN